MVAQQTQIRSTMPIDLNRKRSIIPTAIQLQSGHHIQSSDPTAENWTRAAALAQEAAGNGGDSSTPQSGNASLDAVNTPDPSPRFYTSPEVQQMQAQARAHQLAAQLAEHRAMQVLQQNPSTRSCPTV